MQISRKSRKNYEINCQDICTKNLHLVLQPSRVSVLTNKSIDDFFEGHIRGQRSTTAALLQINQGMVSYFIMF